MSGLFRRHPGNGADGYLPILFDVAYVVFAAFLMLGWWGRNWWLAIGLVLLVIYAKRNDMRGTLFESHATWLIRTFLLSLPFAIVGLMVWSVAVEVFDVKARAILKGLGGFVIFIGWLWSLYRIVRGALALIKGRPVIVPKA
jgi:uncharacterized membrane protein